MYKGKRERKAVLIYFIIVTVAEVGWFLSSLMRFLTQFRSFATQGIKFSTTHNFRYSKVTYLIIWSIVEVSCTMRNANQPSMNCLQFAQRSEFLEWLKILERIQMTNLGNKSGICFLPMQPNESSLSQRSASFFPHKSESVFFWRVPTDNFSKQTPFACERYRIWQFVFTFLAQPFRFEMFLRTSLFLPTWNCPYAGFRQVILINGINFQPSLLPPSRKKSDKKSI